MKQRWKVMVMTAMFVCLLTGCFMRSPGELYAVPKQAEDYFNLQQAIDTVMETATYSAPVSGANRQAVQLKDLDGDGTNEAVLFAKTEGDHPLKIYVFARKGTVFSQIACMEGDGINFDAVYFSQIDGKDGLEMVVGRQLSEGVLRSMSVYALQDDTVSELLNTNYNQFKVIDLDKNGCDDVFLLREDAAQRAGVALLYRWRNEQMQADPQAFSTASAEAVRYVQAGKTEDDAPAVFVASNLDEDHLVTDVFAMHGEQFTNITQPSGTPPDPPVSNGTILFADIDDDGITELPSLLPLASNGAAQVCWLIQWNSLTLDGEMMTKMLTAQSVEEHWYVELRQQWKNDLYIAGETSEGARKTVFYLRGTAPDEMTELFTIYAFSGDDREQTAVQDGRFLLGSGSTATYCASIGATAPISQAQLTAQFHLMPDATNSEG